MTSLIAQWMESHAIDQHLAARIGLYKRHENTLCCPVKRADGSTFVRTRKFPDGDWMQPAGEPLALWWPLGRSSGGSVLVTEGEGDCLAAASILDKTDHPTLNGLNVCGMPGVGAVRVCAEELKAARIKLAYICLDADNAGRNATAKLGELLHEVGIVPFPVDVSPAPDLAEDLHFMTGGTAGDYREIHLAALVSKAKPRTTFPRKPPPPRPAEPLTADESHLKDLPAPMWVSVLAGIEEPRIGQLIRCPFPDHDDSTPSMRVMDRWCYCHGCGAGGDIFSFGMTLWRVGFKEAKERLLSEFADGSTSTQQPHLYLQLAEGSDE